MTWDPEKYREKRERVLGIRKNTVSFGTMAAIASVTILLGFAAVILPNAVSYLQTRHLDDAIYRLTTEHTRSDPALSNIQKMAGVTNVTADHHGGRVVITFDRRHTSPEKIEGLLHEHALSFTLLNRVNHRHHQHVVAQEKEAENETL